MTGRIAKVACTRCYGQGWVAVPAPGAFGCYDQSRCPACSGSGTRLGRVAEAPARPAAKAATGHSGALF